MIDAIGDVGGTRRESHRALSWRVCVDEPELRHPDIEEGWGRDTEKGALQPLVNRARCAGAQVVPSTLRGREDAHSRPGVLCVGPQPGADERL